ncbi:MAG: adenylate/guanylate cyclase domain-containing protein, partial [Roseibium sp.]|nr:adenylate/guanylate cyclase domain-containing protein [Roseibium sp.]
MSQRRKLFITPTLATVIGSFVFVTAAAILVILSATSSTVVRQLGGEIVDIGMESAEIAFIEQLHAITSTAEYTKVSVESLELPLDDPDLLITNLYGTLAP